MQPMATRRQLPYLHMPAIMTSFVCFALMALAAPILIMMSLVHGQVTIIFVASVCAEFFSAVFDPIWIKLGHMLHVRV